jgi:hypothetical protein
MGQSEATLSKIEALLPEEDRDNLASSRFSLLLSREGLQTRLRSLPKSSAMLIPTTS